MTFEIPEDQREKADDWRRNHPCTYADPMNQGAIGGRLTYCFTPTGLGEIVVIKCACGESIDLTDYAVW